MVDKPHLRLAPEELAGARTTLRGCIDAAELSDRLADALCAPAPVGEIAYRLTFSPADRQGVAVDGMLEARLAARCQRCLERMDLELAVPVRLTIPASADAGPDPEPGREQIEAGARPSLADLMEDELLLALPIVPRHPVAVCGNAPGSSKSGSLQRHSPLEGLAELVRRGRD